MSKKGSGSDRQEPRGRSSLGRLGSRSFNPDYTYVLTDLKRIALIGGLLIIGLIVLSFFF